jgi:hypothetical protein
MIIDGNAGDAQRGLDPRDLGARFGDAIGGCRRREGQATLRSRLQEQMR